MKVAAELDGSLNMEESVHLESCGDARVDLTGVFSQRGPIILVEYAHAMGNSSGNMKEF